jgi:predicted dehydrogenase
MTNPISRRIFLGTSALAFGAPSARPADANSRLSVGLLGPGGRAMALLRSFFDVNKECNAELTAVCDIWSRNLQRGVERVKQLSGKEPRPFRRVDELLAWDGLDAVIIATPDHAHARHLMQCLQAGKHVYCEKPFANTLDDANSAIDVCRKTSGKAVTLGTQRRSDPRYLAAADLMRTNPIGPIVRVDIVQNRHSPFRWRNEANVKACKEADTDWKAWLQTKPERKFDPRIYCEFRLFREFSSGIIDQWMSHLIDAAHMLTSARFPKSVVAHGGTYVWKDYRENPDTISVVLDYPEGFLCTYSANLANAQGGGCRITGRQGVLEYEDGWRLVPGNGGKGAKGEEKKIGPQEGLKGTMDQIHMRDWLECVRAGKRETHCTPEHGYGHAMACILAERALWTGRRQFFDDKARTIREG